MSDRNDERNADIVWGVLILAAIVPIIIALWRWALS